MFAWGLMGASGSLIRWIINKQGKKVPSRFTLAIIGFIWGILYGWILNIWFWLLFIEPHTILTFILSNLSSSYFDLLHGLGNAVFLYYYGKKTIYMLERFHERFFIVQPNAEVNEKTF